MSSVRRIEAGAAFIRVAAEDKEFLKSIDSISRRLNRFGNQISRLGAAFGAAGAGLGAPLLLFTRQAADAETAMRRLSLILGDVAGDMNRILRRISQETGVSLVTLTDQAATFASIFAGMRDSLGDQRFLQVLEDVNQQALNLAALSGTSLTEAADRLKSAYTSTGEAVDNYGINIRKANLQQTALNLGIEKSLLLMTEEEKQLLKLISINEQFNRTNINFLNLVNTLNGQLTVFRENLIQISADLGFFLARLLTPIVRQFNELLLAIRPFARLAGGLLAFFAPGIALLGTAAAVLTGIGLASKFIAFVISGFAPILKFLTATGIGRVLAFFANQAFKAAVIGLLRVFVALGGALTIVAGKLIAIVGALFLVVAAVRSIRSSLGQFADRARGGGRGNILSDALTGLQEGSFTGFIFRGPGSVFGEVAKSVGRGLGERLFGRPGAAGGGTRAAAAAAAGIAEARGFIRGPIGPQAAFATAGGAGTAAEGIANLAELWDRVIENDKVKVSQNAS